MNKESEIFIRFALEMAQNMHENHTANNGIGNKQFIFIETKFRFSMQIHTHLHIYSKDSKRKSHHFCCLLLVVPSKRMCDCDSWRKVQMTANNLSFFGRVLNQRDFLICYSVVDIVIIYYIKLLPLVSVCLFYHHHFIKIIIIIVSIVVFVYLFHSLDDFLYT